MIPFASYRVEREKKQKENESEAPTLANDREETDDGVRVNYLVRPWCGGVSRVINESRGDW